MQKLMAVLCLSTFFGLSAKAQPLVIGLESDVPGNRSHVRGIGWTLERATAGKYVPAPLPKDSAEIKNAVLRALNDRKPNQEIIILASGPEGAQALRNPGLMQLKDAFTPPLFFVHSSHMLDDYHDDLLGKVDIIAVPSHEPKLAEFQSKLQGTAAKLSLATGVPHDLTSKALTDALYNEKERFHRFPTDKEKYVLVILPGDAPYKGQQLLYAEAEARKLAAYVGPLCQKESAYLLVTNGPRTGKFNPETMEERKGLHAQGVHDPVTDAFMEQIKHILPSDGYALVGFQHGGEKSMEALFGAIYHKGGVIFAPGESTTQVSQSIDVSQGLGLPAKEAHRQSQVIIVENGAMNPAHKAHMTKEFESGRAQTLTLPDGVAGEWLLNQPTQINKEGRDSAADYIAKEIVSALGARSHVQ